MILLLLGASFCILYTVNNYLIVRMPLMKNTVELIKHLDSSECWQGEKQVEVEEEEEEEEEEACKMRRLLFYGCIGMRGIV